VDCCSGSSCDFAVHVGALLPLFHDHHEGCPTTVQRFGQSIVLASAIIPLVSMLYVFSPPLISCSCWKQPYRLPASLLALNLLIVFWNPEVLLFWVPSHLHMAYLGSYYCRQICSTAVCFHSFCCNSLCGVQDFHSSSALVRFTPTLHPFLCEAFESSTWPRSLIHGVFQLQSFQGSANILFLHDSCLQLSVEAVQFEVSTRTNTPRRYSRPVSRDLPTETSRWSVYQSDLSQNPSPLSRWRLGSSGLPSQRRPALSLHPTSHHFLSLKLSSSYLARGVLNPGLL
jgi:hypothetical protein